MVNQGSARCGKVAGTAMLGAVRHGKGIEVRFGMVRRSSVWQSWAVVRWFGKGIEARHGVVRYHARRGEAGRHGKGIEVRFG